MIFSRATVTELGFVRILVFSVLILDLLIDDLSSNALWSLDCFHAYGLISLIPQQLLEFLLSETGLSCFQYGYLAVLVFGLIGFGPSWLVVGCALAGTTWFHGLARGFGGHINHQELIV